VLYTIECPPTMLELIALPGVGHLPYEGIQTEVDTTLLAWQFVRQYPLGDVPPFLPTPPFPPTPSVPPPLPRLPPLPPLALSAAAIGAIAAFGGLLLVALLVGVVWGTRCRKKRVIRDNLNHSSVLQLECERSELS